MGVRIDQRRRDHPIAKALNVWAQLVVKGFGLSLDGNDTIAAYLDTRRLHSNSTLSMGQDHTAAVDLHRWLPLAQS